ncbi:hypothetical protein G7Y89_g13977 [Cudoniella acicularis]|uniref:Fungal N-terminal domain-containing protein n=1 Tax=Cudoniella acicularis TaxID=354080 RepID=A0A8H4VXQ2_9HELO|nr:hypothetical protein G7Y89_g13977 [Cudoniella acicularis]
MADPVTVIGAVASVAGIVELLVKAVSTLHELRGRWKQAEFALTNLIAQLTALRAALDKLQEWVNADVEDLHHQLVMDLGESMTCCRMLAGKMNAEISDLHRMDGNGLDSQSKIKLVVKNGTLEELQKMAERQTSALTLLLTVCNCKAISDQRVLLEKSSTRKIFQRVRDDSSSLYVQRDSASLYSRCTDNLSKISKVFHFDRELFLSRVYEKALLSSMKDTVENLRRQQSEGNDEKKLQRDSKSEKYVYKVLLLGNEDCKEAFMDRVKMLKLLNPRPLTTKEREECRHLVRQKIWDILEFTNSLIQTSGVGIDETANIYANTISQEIKKVDRNMSVSVEAATAIRGLWTNPNVQLMLVARKGNEKQVFKSDSYFIDQIPRVVQEDYLPTNADLLNALPRLKGVEELKIKIKLNLKLISVFLSDIPPQLEQRERHLQFKTAHSVFYFVDISCYNQLGPENPAQNLLISSLATFNDMVNFQMSGLTKVSLIFLRGKVFAQKLKDFPFGDYFPEYAGGNNDEEASSYILTRFKQVIRRPATVKYEYIASFDTPSVQRLWNGIIADQYAGILREIGFL